MLVLTYRLSTRKPTRSPPVLLHRVKVVVGSETRVKAALVEDLVKLGLPDETSELQKKRTSEPSIGVILQAEDIGGWIRAEGISVPQGRSMGNLDMRKEKFDPVTAMVSLSLLIFTVTAD
jgi:hypothetical protein